MRNPLWIVGLLVWGAVFVAFAHGRSMAPLGYDLQGNAITRLAPNGDRAVVLFFAATDCPISNRYVPEIQRLEKEFAGKPVVFWVVYPNATETESGIVQHQAAYGFEGTVMARPQAEILRLAHATVTPESAVLVPEGEGFRAVYLGRIDDRYVGIGRERPQATRHDLEEAIRAVLGGRPVSAPGGPPVGCGIVTAAALQSGAGKP